MEERIEDETVMEQPNPHFVSELVTSAQEVANFINQNNATHSKVEVKSIVSNGNDTYLLLLEVWA